MGVEETAPVWAWETVLTDDTVPADDPGLLGVVQEGAATPLARGTPVGDSWPPGVNAGVEALNNAGLSSMAVKCELSRESAIFSGRGELGRGEGRTGTTRRNDAQNGDSKCLGGVFFFFSLPTRPSGCQLLPTSRSPRQKRKVSRLSHEMKKTLRFPHIGGVEA